MASNPFRDALGIEVLEAGHGRSVVRMPAGEMILNALGVVHGGALCALADSAIGTALRSALDPGDTLATIEIKLNFIAPARGETVARAQAVHLGRTTAVADVEISDAGGTLVAKGLATFYVKRGAVPARPGAHTAMDPDVDGPEPGE